MPKVARPRELISKATRRAFRDIASAVVLRDIDGAWEDEGFVASDRPNNESGSRRSRFRQYEDSVDWTDHSHVLRALRAFEAVLADIDPAFASKDIERSRGHLDRDGWTLTDAGKIVSRPGGRPPESLAALRDQDAIMDGFDRVPALLPENPREAIGAAKELIESTAKAVLGDLGEEVDERSEDLPGLVSRTQRALHLHPSSSTPGPDGSHAVKKILGGLTAAAVGVGELRNLGYGSGHGAATRPVGLHPRHAYLAVGAARTWCQLILRHVRRPKRTVAGPGISLGLLLTPSRATPAAVVFWSAATN